MKEKTNRCSAPSCVGVGKEMTDVLFTQRAKEGITDGVHQHIGVGMAVQPLGVRDFHPAQNEFAVFDQWMDVITNPNMNHVPNYSVLRQADQGFSKRFGEITMSPDLCQAVIFP